MSEEKQLGQAKRRSKKIYITEIAIEKAPYIEYKGMSREQNMIMRQFARMALRLSKDNYDSNEVAVTWNLETFLFIRQENMKYIVTVSNQGQIHYIKKEENYNAQKAVMLYNTIRQEVISKENSYQIALAFLRRCSEAGLYYR